MFDAPANHQRLRGLPGMAGDGAGEPHVAAPHSHAEQMRGLQIEALNQFAPLLAGVSTLTAIVMSIILSGAIRMPVLMAWTMIVIAFNWLIVRRLEALSFAQLGRAVARRAIVESSLGVGLAAALWVSMPAVSYASQMPEVRVFIAGSISAMLCGALAIAIAPLAAAMWTLILASGLATALWLAGASKLTFAIAALLLFNMSFVLAVTRRLGRLTSRQILTISDQQRTSAELRTIMRDYEEQGTSWLWQTDADNRLVRLSKRIAELLGRPSAQLLGGSLPALLGGHPALGAALIARVPFAGIEVEFAGAGAARTLAFAAAPQFDDARAFLGFRGTASDITEARSSERRLRNLANLDVLTGIPNRHHMRELLDLALDEARRRGSPCAILFLDIDGFKPVNDSFGHAMGDLVLQKVAKRLIETVGDQGIVGRLGGDEFAVVVGDAQTRRHIEELAGALIARVSEPYAAEGSSIRIGLSIGYALGPIDGHSADELVRRADMALYDAKAQGKGQARPYDPRLQREAEDRLRLEADLRDALASDQFRLLYQPLVSAATQEVMGFEALLRWQHPTRGFVSPATFVPIAEETGLMGEIGAWVVRTACRDCATWPSDITVAVNVSPLQLLLPGLPATISSALARAHLPANRLELEVTESVFLHDSDGSLDVLRRLRALGVRIALDDFGTGYSSLGYLNRTIFNKLKIDGSFVRDAGSRPETVSIIQAIVTLANCFQMTITAEGVETNEEYRLMADLGCHQIQGYLFGRPLEYERASELVGKRWDHKLAG